MANLSKVWRRIMDKGCYHNADLSAYVDDELSRSERRKLESHLAGCAACRESLEEIQELRKTFQSLPPVAVGFDLAPLVQGRLAHGKRENRLWLAIRRIGSIWVIPIGATCTLLLGVFLGSILANKLESATVVPGSQDMAMFDVMPPGGLCVGMKSCYSQVEL
jgi:anti-sigma factor RsiW